MYRNRIITPEVILQKISDRIKNKTDELEYLICMERQFEKWIQCELVLSMSDIAIPVLYDNDYEEIKYEFGDGLSEKVRDIGIEYSIEGSKDNFRSDVLIAESPFALKYVDKDNWKIFHDKSEEDCIKEYENSNFHYIELKLRTWVDVERANEIASIIAKDMEKYFKQGIEHFKTDYKASTIISLFFVSFWDSTEKNNVKISKSKALKAVESIQIKLLEECRKKYKKEGRFLWQGITDEIYLLMLYFD